MAALNLCIFSKKSGRLSSASPDLLAFVSHCSVDFQPILDCSVPNSKLKYKDLENMKVGHVNKVVFNFNQIKRRAFFFGTAGSSQSLAPGLNR